MFGGISEPGMGTYLPRVQQYREVPPRGKSRRVRHAPSLAKDRRRGGARPMGLGLRKRWDESHLPVVLQAQK